MSRKSLLVFCDGTGMDGLVTENGTTAGNVSGGPGTYPTNVTRLSRAIQPMRTEGDVNIPQITFYQSGVGSIAGFDGQGLAEDGPLKTYGVAVASKIRDAYCFIAQNYAPGDDICIFGFSRGAYTARKVAGLINRIGLLDRQDFHKFFTYWLQLNNDEKPGPPWPAAPIPVKCVGVWDTVGSILTRTFSPIIDTLSIKDTSLPANVEIALHAVSVQENRKPFMCTLWDIPGVGPRSGQVLKQRWFPGAHSDVGGGYENSELADLALFWMADEISKFIAVDLDYVHKCRQPTTTADWGAHQPHNAWDETGAAKWLMGHKTRLEGKQITKDSDFHLSVEEAPLDLTDPNKMITRKDIEAEFGPLKYAELGSFEQARRDDWKQPSLGGPRGALGLDTPEGFIDRTNKGQLSTDSVGIPKRPAAFRVRNVLSGMMLDLSGGIHGNPVVNYQPQYEKAQKWIFEPTSQYWTIRNANTDGAYLGFPADVQPTAGQPVYADKAAIWTVTEVDGTYDGPPRIELSLANEVDLVLSLADDAKANNTPICVSSRTDSAGQQWILEDFLLPYQGDISPGIYTIFSYEFNTALHLNDDGDIVISQPDGSKNQQWVVEAEGPAGYRISNLAKRDVYVSFADPGDPTEGTKTMGTRISVEWRVTLAYADGDLKLYRIALSGNPSLVMDLQVSQDTDDTPIDVVVWTEDVKNPKAGQSWTFQPVLPVG